MEENITYDSMRIKKTKSGINPVEVMENKNKKIESLAFWNRFLFIMILILGFAGMLVILNYSINENWKSRFDNAYKAGFKHGEKIYKPIMVKDSMRVNQNIELIIRCTRYLCKNPETVLAQACHETGWFSKPCFINGNNLFGMKLTKNNLATGYNFNGNYATYDHWLFSLLDYALWQKTFYKDQNYIQFLSIDKKYAEDPLYGTRIYAMKYNKDFQNMINQY